MYIQHEWCFYLDFCLWSHPFISRVDKYLSASLAVRKQESTPCDLSLGGFSSLLIKLLSNAYGLLERKDLFVDFFVAKNTKIQYICYQFLLYLQRF